MPEDKSDPPEVNVAIVSDEGDGHALPSRVLDRPAIGLLRLNAEQALYVLMLVVAVATRFWGLGHRAMSHDESLHALFSWKLYHGEGYVHDPMMHGPFLFHANALIYFLFGVSDFTARIVPALFGVVTVGLPYLFRHWMGRSGALVASFLLLVGPSFLYYSRYIRNDIYIVVWTLLLAYALFSFVRDRQPRWLVAAAAVLSLSVATKEVAFITAFIGLTFVGLAVVWERLDGRGRAWLQVGLAGFALALLLGITVLHLATDPDPTGRPDLAARLTPNVVFVAMLALAAVAAMLLLPRERRAFSESLGLLGWESLRVPLLVFFGIYVVLFTTFFTNPKGVASGSVGAIVYWLAQQPVQRGSQPWYYYGFLMPFYELIPFFIGVPALAYLAYKGLRRRLAGIPGDGYWLAFLAYWSISSIAIYSWAGEKMPWLIVHLALPLLFVAAQFIGRWIESQDWQDWYHRGGLILGGLLVLMVAALVVLVRVHPFRGLSLRQLESTGQWLASLLILLGLGWLAHGYYQRLRWRGLVQSAKAVGLLLLAALTFRFAWMASYVNYDYVNEFLVYAHGSPDIKVVLGQMEEISRRIAGDRELRFSYDQGSVWPFEWYFKDYPSRIFYGNEPTKTAMEAPVVVVNSDNEAKAKPFLGERYHRFSYRLVWWPMEEYKGLTPAKIWQVLRDGERLQKWGTIWFYHHYPTQFSDWPYQNRFSLYIRKDILNQMWDMGVTLAIPSEAPGDPYQEVWRELAASLTVGSTGEGPGQFRNPRGIAVGPEGRIYVVDSGNNRIQVFGPDGEFLDAWGRAGTGPGQFTEPWGIGVAANGDVYVADTWNHRIQWFDAERVFKGMWGYFADTGGNVADHPSGFWGPRDVAIGVDGHLYVTDTGNKRVQEFTPDGQFVEAFGGLGTGSGRFDEPVGIAVDPEGVVYVADTWNQRIQYFDSDLASLGEWRVESWQGQSLVNKPYLVADATYVYASDPEGYRILVFDKAGSIQMTFGRYGEGITGLNLSTGLALDGQGRLWVADTQNNRVLRFDNPQP